MLSTITWMRSLCSIFVLLGSFKRADAASFTAPTSNIVYANGTGYAPLMWTYALAAGDTLNLISCGILPDGSITPQHWIEKRGSGVVEFKDSNIAASVRTRLAVIDNRSNKLGINISQPAPENGKRFACSMIFSNGGIQPPISSGILTVFIVVAPRFVNCLSSNLSVVQGNAVNVSCSVYGKPDPTLTCQILDISGNLIQELGKTKQNITTTLITNVQQNYGKITCTAHDEHAGMAVLTKDIVVYHVPTKPENFRRVSSTTSSINLAWGPPTDNGGLQLINYLVEYGLSSNSLQSRNVSANQADTSITGLESEKKYILRIRARNQLGLGEKAEITADTVVVEGPDSGERSDSNKVVVIVVPIVVIVVLIIVVVVGVFVLKKRKKPQLPTSYIEEAVAPSANPKPLYATAQKPKRPIGYTESTSGYPDVIHQTNERPVDSYGNESYVGADEATDAYEPRHEPYGNNAGYELDQRDASYANEAYVSPGA